MINKYLGLIICIFILGLGNSSMSFAQDIGLKQIAFESRRDGNKEIYIIQLDGENLINLTNHLGDDQEPDWSPDGNQIAFSSDRDGDFDIWVMDADGSNLVNITNTNEDEFYPRWSPDGKQILYQSLIDDNLDIYVITLDDGNITRLTHNPFNDYHASWSPDGKQIVFVSERGGDLLSSEQGKDLYEPELYVMDIKSAITKIVSSNYGIAPQWISQDEIIFISNNISLLNLETSYTSKVIDLPLLLPYFDVYVNDDVIQIIVDAGATDFGLWYFNDKTKEKFKINNTGPLDDNVSWRPLSNISATN